MSEREFVRRYLTGASTDSARPDAVGRKFDKSGTVLRSPGNTAICHLDRNSDAFGALVQAQEKLKSSPLADAYSFLPPESFHMTIFEGVIETARVPERWPRHLPLDAPIDAVSADFSSRLDGLGLAQSFRVRSNGIVGGFSVSMTGTTEDDEALLRRTRDRLREATNIIRSDHAEYRFHITLGYLLRWLSAEEADGIISLSAQLDKTLAPRLSQVVLGPVEFCRFENMHFFERLHFVD